MRRAERYMDEESRTMRWMRRAERYMDEESRTMRRELLYVDALSMK